MCPMSLLQNNGNEVEGGCRRVVDFCLFLPYFTLYFYFSPKGVWSHWEPLYIYTVNSHELFLD